MKIAEWRVVAAPARLLALGLGSCVAIVLHDSAARVGGLAHVLLPEPAPNRAVEQPARFPGYAVPLMLEEMRALGATGSITGRLVGGASLFGGILTREGGAVGARNITAAREALKVARIPVVGELVGGTSGRSVYFDVGLGRVDVKSLQEGHRVL